ncbi:MAG: LamG-like jellyroll fold domain-containing protein, partial [Planctomycetota bacterium]
VSSTTRDTDTQAPTSPPGFVSTSVSATEVGLHWNASTDDVEVAEYRVFRDGVEIASLTASQTSFSDAGRSPDSFYDYEVIALDTSGNESTAAGPIVGATLPLDAQAPTTPANLLASAVSPTRIDLSWTASTDNVGVTGYRLLKDGVEIALLPNSQTSYIDQGLSPETSHDYEVFALDAAGNISGGTAVNGTSLPTTLGLFRAWGFEEGSGSHALDSSGNSGDGVLENGASRAVSGYFGESLQTDGTSGNVDLGTLDIPTSEMTIMVWFNADDFGVADARLVSKSTGAQANDHLWMLSTIRGPSLRFRLKTDDSSDTTTLIGSGGTFSAGTWVHAAATYDGTTMRIFQNGIEVGSVAKSGAIAQDPTVRAWIGGNPGRANQVFDGRIDEVKIFGRALSAAEIVTEMDKAAPPIFDAEAPTEPLALQALATSSSTIDLSWDPSTDNAVLAGYRVFQDGVELGTTTELSFTVNGLSPETTYGFSVLAFDASGNESTTAGPIDETTEGIDTESPTTPGLLVATTVSAIQIDLTWTSSTDNVGVVNYRLLRDGIEVALIPGTQVSYTDLGLTPDTTFSYDLIALDAEGNESLPATNTGTTLASSTDLLVALGFESSGTEVSDGSGNANHGVLENGATRSLSGYTGSALETDGSAGNVDLGYLDIPSNQLTIMCWIRADDFGTRDARIVSKSTGSAANDHLWMLSTIGGPSLRFRLKTDDGNSTATLIGSGATLTAGTWIHATATYDGSTMRLYQDGVEVASIAKSGNIAQDPTVKAWVAGNPGRANQVFDGRIDDFKIFTRALSPAEVAAEMIQPAP